MASLTLKDIPDPLLERLRERAESDRRSLTQEILFLLEEALRGAGGRSRADTEAQAQADAWARLAGEWPSDRDKDEEIEEILGSRTRGRELDSGKTAGGVPITDELVGELVARAEAGHDVDEILQRRRGRPAIGSGPAGVESVRLDPDLRQALVRRAQHEGETTSSVIRKALRRYLEAR